ncbi:RNA-directed DNA polymerase, eukaryota, reverse transcriptase zinc-binding domain protein [Tanacetum coccineum]
MLKEFRPEIQFELSSGVVLVKREYYWDGFQLLVDIMKIFVLNILLVNCFRATSDASRPFWFSDLAKDDVNSMKLIDRRSSERNFWDIPIHNDVCWSWRKILHCRDVLRNHIVTRIDGWFKKFPFIFHLPHPLLFHERNDKVLWRSNDGKVGNFSAKAVWSDIIPVKPVVPWDKIVWFSQNIPRHSFILWLAINKKLKTQDKMVVWLRLDSLKCSLCNEVHDDHNHLSFGCRFSSSVWNFFKGLMKFKSAPNDVYQVLDFLLSMPINKSIWSIIQRIVLGSVVYVLWQERNLRLFQGNSRTVEVICNIIKDLVRLWLLSLKIKGST